jgi:NADPH-dependent 2,4-dienoyl-CoA reductase/sulfur reductase-like enzyme
VATIVASAVRVVRADLARRDLEVRERGAPVVGTVPSRPDLDFACATKGRVDKGVLVERVGVVGCGLMGSGIAEIAARAGADVVVIERDEEVLAAGHERIEHSISRAVAANKMPDDEANLIRGNLSFSVDFDRLSDRDIVIEAVAEDEAVKVDVFKRLDAGSPTPGRSWPPTRRRSPSSSWRWPPSDRSR